ncbi:MAG: hypothetical protein RLZZ271_1026 [Pseudomonadota bacterium]
MYSQGRPMHVLRQIAERYPVVMHGVSLSIGSTEPLNTHYLHTLKKLARQINAAWVSDHLCWTGVHSVNTHDLLPLPLNEESLRHVVQRVKQAQDILERPLVLENPSSYVGFAASTLSEPAFLAALHAETGCGLLLDVNNCHVSSFNHGWDAHAYLSQIPAHAVAQMHLAGHQHCGTHIIDTHDRPVRPEVWELYRRAHQLTGGASASLEWDGHIPDFETCHAELLKARAYQLQMVGETAHSTPPEPQATNASEPLAVPNPVNFLVAPVYDNVHCEAT